MDYEEIPFDTALVEQLVDVLYKQLTNEYSSTLSNANIEKFSFGIVKSADNEAKTAIVEFTSYNGELTETLNNLTGLELSEGDTVKVFYDNNNMKNAYIKIKC